MDPVGILFNCPELVSKYIFQKFDLDRLECDTLSCEEKVAILNQVMKVAKLYPAKYYELQRAVLQRILAIQEANGIVEKKTLLEYLKDPYTTKSQWIRDIHVKNLALARSKSKEESIPGILFVLPNDDKLIKDCLRRLFRTETDYSEFELFVNSMELKKLFWTEKLLQGQECPNSKDYFTESELKLIFSHRELVFLENNSKQYKQNDKAQVNLRVKNVTKLTVRIFEVNTLNFVLENKNQNYQSIDVSGLIPSGEYEYQFTQNAIVAHEELFRFQNIEAAERGVFIVDFIGEDVKARCVLYKGGLSLVYEKKHGRSCLIFDQAGKVCKGRGTGIYIGSTFFEANQTSGVINIPITIGEVSQEVVTVHNGFASLCMLITKDPRPQFSTTLVYNSEGFIAGNKVNFLIEPMLKLYQKPASVMLLSNLNATIVITNVQNVQTKTDFKDLKISDNKDIVVDLIFPPQAREISVIITANLNIKKEPEIVTHSHLINIDRNLTGDIHNVFFQKNTQDQVMVLVLGKNGEKRKNMCVDLNVTLKHKTSDQSFKLISDEQGSCNLGKVENFSLIRATCGSVVAYLKGDESSERVYPDTILLKENEALDLPINPEQDEISLHSYTSSGLIKDEVPKTAYSIADKQLHIKGLEKGTYLLMINDNKINIQVIQGDTLNDNQKFLWTSEAVFSLDEKAKVWFQSKRVTDEYIEFNVKTESKNLRARLLTYNFIPEDYHQLKNTAASTLSSSKSLLNNENSYDIKRNWNTYSAQIKLGDELVYTYDRRDKKTFMGNTLEKPGVILKREKVKETTETDQELAEGEAERHQESENRKAYPRMMAAKMCEKSKACYSRQLVNLTNLSIKVKEFLESPGLLIPDIEIKDGLIKIPKALVSKYSFSYLYLSDGNFSSILSVWQDQIALKLKDCTLQESKKDGYIYSYSREVNFVNANKKVTVDNISSTQISLVTSLKELFEAYQTLVFNGHQIFQEWTFLYTWNSLAPMEKLKKYDKFASHELNLFLYFKDNEFFTEVVAPFLENKKEKKVVDFFLLNKINEFSRYFDVSKAKQLNLLEQVLLAIFANKTKPEFTSSIVGFLKSKAAVNKLSNERINTLFEALLNVNSEVKAPGITTSVLRGGRTNNMNYDGEALLLGCSARNYSPQMQMEACEEEYEQCNNMFGDDEQIYQQETEVYTKSQGTVEYIEKQYFDGTFNSPSNEFWIDFLQHMLGKNSNKDFGSLNFLTGVNSLSELILALAVVDLPFEKPKIESNVSQNALNLQSSSNFYLLSKEVVERKGERLDMDVICSQKIFDPEDPIVYDDEDPEVYYDKPVDEYLINKPYASRIVITNSSPVRVKVSRIFEIPEGSIPTDSLDTLKIEDLTLEQFSSSVIEFRFYFPKAGAFNLFPATVVSNGRIINIAKCIIKRKH